MGELIAVLSGKGGTGKTSVCAGLATALAVNGNRVLCVDCDVGLRNLDISLGMSECGALSFLDICSGGYKLSQATAHPKYPSLHFLTAPVNCPPEQIDMAAFGAFLDEARKSFSYVFLDAPAGVDAGFKLAASFADRCVIVTGPSPAAIRDAARVGEILELMGKSDARLVVNRVSKPVIKAMALTIDDVMDGTGLPLLGIIPEDRHVVLAASAGQALLHYSRRCPASAACRRIAKRIQGQSVPITLR